MSDSEKPTKPSRNRKFVLGAWALAAFVVLMIAILFVFHPDERFDRRRLKESVLKIDLETMREAMDKYILDKQKPPQSLQELVDANYLRAIPVDPMTGRRDWCVEFGDVPSSASVVREGVIGVHSSSGKTSVDGTPYDTW